MELSEKLQAQIKSFQAHAESKIQIQGFHLSFEAPASLKFDPQNAMTHTPKNLKAIGDSLNAFGFRKGAICVKEETRVIYAGNGLIHWCLLNNIPLVPVCWIPKEMTEQEAQAFALSDNQSARLGEWDFENMADTLKSIEDAFTKEDLNLDTAEIEQALSQIKQVDDSVLALRELAVAAPTVPTSGLIRLLFAPTEVGTVGAAGACCRSANGADFWAYQTLICPYRSRHR